MATVVYSNFSYTLESLVLARERSIRVRWVPVGVNPPLRPPRLYTSTWDYLRKSAFTILRTTWMTRPSRILTPVLVVAWGAGITGAIFAGLAVPWPWILGATLASITFQAGVFSWMGSSDSRSRRATERHLLQLSHTTLGTNRFDNEGVDSPSLTG